MQYYCELAINSPFLLCLNNHFYISYFYKLDYCMRKEPKIADFFGFIRDNSLGILVDNIP